MEGWSEERANMQGSIRQCIGELCAGVYSVLHVCVCVCEDVSRGSKSWNQSEMDLGLSHLDSICMNYKRTRGKIDPFCIDLVGSRPGLIRSK